MAAAFGAAASLPMLALMLWWQSRESALLLQWPLSERGEARLDIDGKQWTLPIEDPAMVEVEPGEHHVLIRRRGYEPIEWQLRFSPGERVERQVEWRPVDLSRPFNL
jgi:hypothetical protein